LIPAFSAGPSRVTSSTMTPLAAGNFILATSSSLTSRTETPIQPDPPRTIASARGLVMTARDGVLWP
jgi:hypothetical protein